MSAPTPAAVKETKAQKSERLKLAKNPWDAWDEVRQFAREGRESVLPEWAGDLLQVVGHLHPRRWRGCDRWSRWRRQGH